jgi:arylformamidase
MSETNRGYDQNALDRQFMLHIEDLDALMARRAAAAEAARQTHPHLAGLAYGPETGQALDIYPAHGAEDPAPAMVFIHGGFWRSLAAADFAFVANGFAPFGVTTVVIDYPLIPQTDLAGIEESCLGALAWIRAQAGEFGIDPEHLHISGNSAGGHLVAELAETERLASAGLPRDAIKSITAISGLFELEPVRLSFQNDTLGFDEATVARFSPLRHVPAGAPPMLVAVGGEETQEFLDQSADYAKAYAEAGNAAELMVVEGADHVTVVLDHFANPDAALNRKARALMGFSRDG